ncbi:MAG: anthranilate phosphoribosyltransferase [Deltaproteobacteria bacterium]|nr:anthranilate phosphoribosyltransferase [Deltaproteobacteria bacterium]
MTQKGGVAIRSALACLLDGDELGTDATAAAVEEIMSGGSSAALVGAFLAALRVRGETVDQIVGAARTMRARADRVASRREPLVDNCGTGGDGGRTFSISTAAALVAAAGGASVAKHGNRAASGKFGGADTLEALGVAIDLPADRVGRCIDQVGIGFLFARRLHPAMRHVGPVRTELGVRTIFNLLGPLTNPAGVRRQVVGVASKRDLERVAGALRILGVEHALVVHGRDGLDEISLAAPADVVEIRGDSVRELVVDASTFGLPEAPPEAVHAETLEESVQAVREVLDGAPGPRADVVAANAGMVLHVAGRAESLAEGARLAGEAIASGGARDVLRRLAEATQAGHADASRGA